MDVYHDEQNVYDLRQRITEQVRHHPTWGHLEVVWDNLGLQLKTIEDGLGELTQYWATLIGIVCREALRARMWRLTPTF